MLLVLGKKAFNGMVSTEYSLERGDKKKTRLSFLSFLPSLLPSFPPICPWEEKGGGEGEASIGR
jgi:hypothetical protein